MASRLVALFKTSLKRHPILTNTGVYLTFYTAAELSQQTYNKYYTEEKPDINYGNMVRIATIGSGIYAPTLYVWYKFLDRKFVGTAVKPVMTKVMMDQLIMTPILLAAFYTTLGIFEGKADIFLELREKYVKTFLMNQAFWMPGQTINFFFVPPNFRVVYVATVSFLWINVLCFIKRQKLTEHIKS